MFRSLLLGCALLLAGCPAADPRPDGGSVVDGGVMSGADAGEDAGSTDAGQPVAAADFCPLLADAICDRAARCGWLQSAQRSACVRINRSVCENPDNFGPASRGLAAFDGLAASACLAGQTTLPCAVSPELTNDACGRVLTVDAGVGAPCTTAQPSCARGSFCSGVSADTCVCRALTPLGGDCTSTPCFGALRCDVDGGTSTCVERLPDGAPCSTAVDCASFVCLARDGGSTCGALAPGEACDPGSGRPCRTGDYCRGVRHVLDATGSEVPASDGVCAARVGSGAACTREQFDDGCPPGERCHDGRCSAHATLSVPVGGACSNPGACETAWCEGSSMFLADGGPNLEAGRCGALLAPGQPCGQGLAPCAAPASCVSNACALPPSEGAPCSSLCTYGTFCPPNGSGRVCTAYGLPGEPCGNNRRCEEGLFCDTDGGTLSSGGLCAAPRGVGERCTGSVQCATQLCRTDAGMNGAPSRPGTCQPACL